MMRGRLLPTFSPIKTMILLLRGGLGMWWDLPDFELFDVGLHENIA